MITRVYLFFLLNLLGCDKIVPVASKFDSVIFNATGGTFFQKPKHVTLKEVHLDNGQIGNKPIVIEGTIEEANEFDTFLVINDESAKVLVVTTEIVNSQRNELNVSDQIRVFGELETGKKGLPYIRALAMKRVTKEGDQGG